MENYFFLQNYVTSEGTVSHNVLFYQPLPITRYQVRFYVAVLQCMRAIMSERRAMQTDSAHTHCNIVTPLLQNGLAQQQNNAFAKRCDRFKI